MGEPQAGMRLLPGVLDISEGSSAMPTASVALVECDQCGDDVPDIWSTTDGREVCQSCIDQFHTECDRCHEYARHTVTTAEAREVCDDCAWRLYRCDRCERRAIDTVRTADSSDICNPCADNWYWECDRCGDLISEGDHCESCETYYDDDDDSDYANFLGIHEYSYKPEPSFHGNGPLFLGAEIEIGVPRHLLSDAATVATSRLGELGYLKEDSSIDGAGFEIVTHPMSYAWAMEHFPWDMLTDLRSNGGDAAGNGLHVHVSRAAFANPCHAFRWMKFFYRNVRQVTTVARRESNEWARFDARGRRNVKDYAKGAKGSRYQAINTENDDTFELRIFASSLNAQEVKAALGLAAASVEYTRTLSVSDIAHHNGWEWSSFVAWLTVRPEYAPLTRELEALSCAC